MNMDLLFRFPGMPKETQPRKDIDYTPIKLLLFAVAGAHVMVVTSMCCQNETLNCDTRRKAKRTWSSLSRGMVPIMAKAAPVLHFLDHQLADIALRTTRRRNV
jgi:hypothetical protein